MEIDAYFNDMNEASEYIKKHRNQLIVVDERKEDNLFGFDKEKCLVEKAKLKCKCNACNSRRFWESQLLFSRINSAIWDTFYEGISNQFVKKQKAEVNKE